MTRRPGLTMTEALVAIFITAIGLVGVMSMFPFGAKQMSDALISDRSTSLATSIDGLVRSYWKERVVEGDATGDPFWDAMDAPGTAPDGASLTRQSDLEPGYPVFLDPMGCFRPNANSKNWVGDANPTPTRVPRRTMNLVGNSSGLALRLFSQPDGFSWDDESRPKVDYDVNTGKPTTSSEMRELRYNALAVLQRPTNGNRDTATFKVVVFINRRHQFFPNGSEAVFDVRFTPGTTQLQIATNADIRKGSWIMDATINPGTTVRHANFYRVVSATDNGSTVAGNPVYDVELHTPIKRVDGRNNPTTDWYDGKAVVLAGVADIFDRPMLTGNTNP